MDNQDQKSTEEKQQVNNKFDNFQFDQVIKKKPAIVKSNEEQEAPKPKKEIEIKKKPVIEKKIKQKKRTFKYGHYTFKKIEDLNTFFLLEYHSKEKHATRLLQNEAFIDWLSSMFEDKTLFNEWVEEIL